MHLSGPLAAMSRGILEAGGSEGSGPRSTVASSTEKDHRQAEVARLRTLSHGVATTTNLLEPPLRLVDGPSFAAQYEDIFVWECYDFPCDHPSPTIIDGGANVGAATIWWLARWPKARVVAFEPDPHVFEALAWNIRFLGSVELHKCALSGGDSSVFWSEGTDAGRLGSAEEEADRVIRVPTIALSEVLDRLGSVDLLKLDIEGAETEVLEEAEEGLRRVGRIFVEYHSLEGRQQRLDSLLLLLQRQRFRYYIESPARRVRPFRGVPVDRGIDFQCNIFAWRPTDGGPTGRGPAFVAKQVVRSSVRNRVGSTGGNSSPGDEVALSMMTSTTTTRPVSVCVPAPALPTSLHSIGRSLSKSRGRWGPERSEGAIGRPRANHGGGGEGPGLHEEGPRPNPGHASATALQEGRPRPESGAQIPSRFRE